VGGEAAAGQPGGRRSVGVALHVGEGVDGRAEEAAGRAERVSVSVVQHAGVGGAVGQGVGSRARPPFTPTKTAAFQTKLHSAVASSN
jgi:hypothetical protein